MSDSNGILIEVSCVVLANAHNPSILNPDWLEANGLLPKELTWELIGPIIVTPALARVVYQNGVSILLETGKLIITLGNVQDYEGGIPATDLVSGIASRYIAVLTHIPYGAVGNNFKIMQECEGASQKLVRAFGNNGPWKEGLDSVQTKFSYKVSEETVCNLDVSPGTVGKATTDSPPTEQEIILCAVNYHHEVQGSDAAAKAVNQMADDFKSGTELTSKILENICA